MQDIHVFLSSVEHKLSLRKISGFFLFVFSTEMISIAFLMQFQSSLKCFNGLCNKPGTTSMVRWCQRKYPYMEVPFVNRIYSPQCHILDGIRVN